MNDQYHREKTRFDSAHNEHLSIYTHSTLDNYFWLLYLWQPSIPMQNLTPSEKEGKN